MGRLFGTDGVRGVANRELTADLALQLAAAAASVLVRPEPHASYRPVAVVGRDPRASGEFLEAAVVAGLASHGVDVCRLGVLPTPAVAYLTAASDADFGVMLSASHNPMPDNGIKFFARGGHKLDDRDEDAVEAALGRSTTLPTGADVGRVVDSPEASTRYVSHLTSTITQSLTGLRIVLDCANGAAYRTAPLSFTDTGAEVIAIHDAPNGLDINDECGSTHLQSLRESVLANDAHCGFAFDGDADRCLAVDSTGEVVDGDQILAILALAMQESGALVNETVVATVMSNLGFLQAMRRHEVAVVQTSVGDRYVLEEMRAKGYTLGGEQSGHVIMSAHASTGDGVLAALHVAARMASTRRSLHELAGVMDKLPQVMVNVSGVDRSRTGSDPAVRAAVQWAESALGETGRVLLRSSGTEPLVRVMVEAETLDEARGHAERLAGVVKAQLAL